MHWSVEEQTIPTTALDVQAINLRVDPSSSHDMVMELMTKPDPAAEKPVAGYALHFNRNGAFVAAVPIPVPPLPEAPPPDPEATSSHSSSHGKSKK